jgi:alginate O-acetyltransferase complex protein AlgJ
MKTPCLSLARAFGVLVLSAAGTCYSASSPASVEPAGRLAGLVARAAEQQRSAIRGAEDWLFLTAELRHLSAGRFWNDDAAALEQGTGDASDPLPVMTDFYAQLKMAGVELIVVPVPAKAAVYPDKLGVMDSPPAHGERIDKSDAAFYRVCGDRGIRILDPGSDYLQARATDPPTFCKTDSHWSGRGCVLVAELLSKEIRTRSWFASVPKRTYRAEWRETAIHGDVSTLVSPQAGAENVALRYVTDETGQPPADWRQSPVLLLGDSHTLVFHAGEDMHGTGAGLADQLAFDLGFAVDVVGVRGSGATPARINLLRRKDNLAGKKLVIWCFSAREFTEASGGWRRVPVIDKQ